MSFPLRPWLQEVGEICHAESVEVGIIVADRFPPRSGAFTGPPPAMLFWQAVYSPIGDSLLVGGVRHRAIMDGAVAVGQQANGRICSAGAWYF